MWRSPGPRSRRDSPASTNSVPSIRVAARRGRRGRGWGHRRGRPASIPACCTSLRGPRRRRRGDLGPAREPRGQVPRPPSSLVAGLPLRSDEMMPAPSTLGTRSDQPARGSSLALRGRRPWPAPAPWSSDPESSSLHHFLLLPEAEGRRWQRDGSIGHGSGRSIGGLGSVIGRHAREYILASIAVTTVQDPNSSTRMPPSTQRRPRPIS
jgi:hypothetical protein